MAANRRRTATREERAAVIALIDIDGLDSISDTLGPETTDQILEVVGARLRGAIRHTDTLACPGGPHFTLVIDCPGDTDRLCRRFLRAVAEPLQIAGRSLWVTASIGAAHRDNGHDPTDHFKCAGVALQQAADGGGDRYILAAD